MEVAVVRAAALAALVEGALRAMVSSKFLVIAAFAATSLTVILTSLLVISASGRPVRSDQGPAPIRTGIVARAPRKDASTQDADESETESIVTVKRSDFRRTTTQPGTVRPSQLVDVYPKVPGELTSLSIDIGDPVRRGQVVAVIDAPEVRAELGKSQAMVELAQARAHRVGAAVRVAEAMLRSERAKVDVAAAELKSSDTVRARRVMERIRVKELSDRNTVERRVLAEEDKWLESAEEMLLAKKALLAVARADVQAAEARVEAARAELDEARADVRLAEASQAGAEIQAGAAASSPRSMASSPAAITTSAQAVGTAATGGSQPLLTIVQASQVRVVVRIPHADAVLLDKGDPVTFRPDAFDDREYQGTISRTAVAEEQGSVQAEIDLNNADAQLRPGEAGCVTVTLEAHPDALTIPVEAILGRRDGTDGLLSCYRIADGLRRQDDDPTRDDQSGQRHRRGARRLERGRRHRPQREDRRGPQPGIPTAVSPRPASERPTALVHGRARSRNAVPARAKSPSRPHPTVGRGLSLLRVSFRKPIGTRRRPGRRPLPGGAAGIMRPDACGERDGPEQWRR